MSHAESKYKYYAPSQLLQWSSLSSDTVRIGDEEGGSVGFIPFYRTREEVINLFGNVQIMEFQSVEKVERQEEVRPSACCKREGCQKERKATCRGKSCKANRSVAEGDGRC